MKKLFAFISVTFLMFCALFGSIRHETILLAEQETSEPVESSSEPIESSSEPLDSEKETEDSEELEPIDTNKELDNLSQTAKDVIEVIKTIFNQPIVIGGVSFTLGTIFIWLFGKAISHILSKRNTKYDEKIKELLKKLGVSEEQIKELFDNIDMLYNAIKVLTENTKNIKVKQKLQELLLIQKEQLVDGLEMASDVVEDAKEQVAEEINDANDKIKELLEKE